MLVLPLVRREPLPGDLQAHLNYGTGVLVIDSSIPEWAVPAFRAEATLCLSGRRDLAVHVDPPPPPRLQVLRGGLEVDEAS